MDVFWWLTEVCCNYYTTVWTSALRYMLKRWWANFWAQGTFQGNPIFAGHIINNRYICLFINDTCHDVNSASTGAVRCIRK